MDIRKFFTPPSKKPQLQEEGSFIKSNKKKPHKRKGVLFDSDSDEEDPIPKNVKKELDSSDIVANSGDEFTKSKRKNKKKKKLKETTSEKLKETTPSAFFGQFKTSNSKPSMKRKASGDNGETKPKISKKSTDEVVIIDDDLEEITPKPKIEKVPQTSETGGTVSSKLSQAAGRRNQHKTDKNDRGAKQKEKTEVSSKINIAKEDDAKMRNVPATKTKQEKPVAYKSEEIASPQKVNGSKSPKPLKSTNKMTPEKKITPALDRTDSGNSKQEKFLKFQQWQNRSGPSAPGSKEVPEGKSNCFEGMIFVITGVQESLTRDEIRSLVERYGGKVTTSVSSRTSYLITGVDAGESKIKKAEQHRTKMVDEDQFLDLLRTLPGKRSKYEVYDEPHKMSKTHLVKNKSEKVSPKQDGKKEGSKSSYASGKHSQSSQESCSSLSASQKEELDGTDLMWVDKYKPKTIKQIIGQQGPSSNMHKLLNWLKNWHSNHRTAKGRAKPKPKINMWGGGDPTGASLKAALLSGPPGVGKTTTATLVCKELGLPFVELNASDQRSKKTLKEDVFASVQNTSISSLMGREDQTSIDASQHVLIMDEVDGMAGNEDRGGIQELIQIIKSTKIPIICMCNDRSSPKIRSLVYHCFDLRFQRPRVEQITSSIMSICYKEGVKAQAPAVQAIIRGCNQDIRQVLHNLNMLKSNNSSLTYDDAKSHADHSQKDVNLGIFDIARKLLSSETANMSLLDKSNLFFMDYSMVPKFIQENYINVTPFAAQGNIQKQLDTLSKTADSIACGDLIESAMRQQMTWSMLPTLGLMSTILPCDFMRGIPRGAINFPAFFGKLSTTGKNHRLLQQLKFHASVSTGGSTEETFNLDLVPYLRWHLSWPLLNRTPAGDFQVSKATQLLDDYDFTKEDFDNLMEVGHLEGRTSYISQVDSKVKSAFTRTYNKESHLTPYAVESAAAKKKRKAAIAAEDDLGEDADSQEDEGAGNDDMGKDGMIKEVKKKASVVKNRTKKEVAGPSKAKRGKKK